MMLQHLLACREGRFRVELFYVVFLVLPDLATHVVPHVATSVSFHFASFGTSLATLQVTSFVTSVTFFGTSLVTYFVTSLIKTELGRALTFRV